MPRGVSFGFPSKQPQKRIKRMLTLICFSCTTTITENQARGALFFSWVALRSESTAVVLFGSSFKTRHARPSQPCLRVEVWETLQPMQRRGTGGDVILFLSRSYLWCIVLGC